MTPRRRTTVATTPARLLRLLRLLCLFCLLCLLCPVAEPVTTWLSTSSRTAEAAAAPAAGPRAGPGLAQGASDPASTLIVEPDAGMAPIYALLRRPRHRLDLAMYELADPVAERILEDDAARGVAVRVILDQNRERRANTPAYIALRAHGIEATWAAPAFEAMHEKAMVIDAGSPDAEAVIMTLNLTARSYRQTRDVAVVDPDPPDVAAIESTFTSDFAAADPTADRPAADRPGPTAAPDLEALARSVPAPAGADLVWSPGSQPALVSVIRSAVATLEVENEEMGDQAIVDALAGAARRGVRVTVVMTDQSDDADQLAELTAAGVSVRLYPDTSTALYIHAKVIVADGTRAFVGSENFTSASLDRNRELGLVTTQRSVVSGLGSMIATDAARAPLR
jgi:cardiolipin synthase A/B